MTVRWGTTTKTQHDNVKQQLSNQPHQLLIITFTLQWR